MSGSISGRVKKIEAQAKWWFSYKKRTCKSTHFQNLPSRPGPCGLDSYLCSMLMCKRCCSAHSTQGLMCFYIYIVLTLL